MEHFSGDINAMAFGGEGILRHNELVVFVPLTAIGDTISCQITKQKKNFAHGEMVELLKPSKDRTSPSCPYFGTCGGCQLQHLNENSQLEHKRQVVLDGLNRIAQLNIESIPSTIKAETQWAYRRHITLSIRFNSKGTFSVGYIAKDNRSLLEINQCPIFTNPDDPIIQEIAEFACLLKQEGKVMILKHENHRYLLAFHFQHKPESGFELAKKFMATHQSWAGVLIKAPGYTKALGITTSQFQLDGLTFTFSPEAFIQNHAEQSAKIYKAIKDIATGKNTVLDLYCGIGITTLLIGRENSVVGVESNAEAIKLAKDNAKKNQIQGVQFIQADVKEVLPDLLTQLSPTLVIINPPRQGMEKEVVKALIEKKTKELIYVSCMPSTLARDLKELCQAGYQVKLCQTYDMFPQTAHVETLVHLAFR